LRDAETQGRACIVKTLILASADPMEHVLPHHFGDRLFHWNVNWTSPLYIVTFSPHDTYFTNHLLMTIVAAVVMLLIFPRLGRRYAAALSGSPDQHVPSGFTNLLESMLQFIREGVVRPVLGDKTDRFMPFLWTMFFFILTCNLLGLVPLAQIIGLVTGGRLEHIGGTATGNIMVTTGLAICSFLMIHGSGATQVYRDLVAGTYGHHDHDDESDQGHAAEEHAHHRAKMSPPLAAILCTFLYLWNFAPHVFAPQRTSGILDLILWVADFIMWAILLALEFIGALIKPFALAIRLFANMVAGHIVLATIVGLILAFRGFAMQAGGGLMVAAGCAALSCLELFVAFLQAYIFVFLTTLFIGASVAPEH
jgi:F-type H+-transporting ATPase subunit a